MSRNWSTSMPAVVLGFTLVAGVTSLPAAATIPLTELEGRIVFIRWGGYNNGFFIANVDGSDEQRLVAIPPGDVCCLWVADDGSRASVPAGSWSAATETVEIVDLEDLSTVVLDRLSGDVNTIGGPFSPDGSQIAYNEDGEPSGFPVYIGPSDDPSAAVRIVPTEAKDHGHVFAVDFSPNGHQLVLYVPAPGDVGNTLGSLATINVDGSGFRPLTPEGLDVPCCAHWSPDGTRIVFADRDGRLLTIRPDGSGLTEVYSEADSWALQPNWSPDGSRSSSRGTRRPTPTVLHSTASTRSTPTAAA